MVATLARLRVEWLARGWPAVHMGVGIDTGPTVVGNFGSPVRFSYTAMGDHVNRSSRIEGLTKVYGTAVLVTEQTRRAAGDAFRWREVDRVRVVGKREPVVLFELLGAAADDADGGLARRAEDFAPLLAAYRARRFAEVVTGCNAFLAAWPDDGPARLLRTRAAGFATAPPPDAWDGVWDADAK